MAQMRLAKDDDVVQAFAANGPNQSFGKTVLPGRARRDRFIPNAHCAEALPHASSRAFDLKGETKMARTNQRSPITRSAYAIRPPPQRAEVFGTHRPA